MEANVTIEVSMYFIATPVRPVQIATPTVARIKVCASSVRKNTL
jgi:hypothetical protein